MRREFSLLLFFIPPLVPLAITLLSIGLTVSYSFTDLSLLGGHYDLVGLRNYVQLYHDPIFYQSLLNNLILLGYLVLVPLTFGLLISILLSRNLKGSLVFKSAFFFPMIVSFVVSGNMWAWMFQTKSGLINTVLRQIGLGYMARSWISDPSLVVSSIGLVGVWQAIGYSIVLFGAGLVDIPHELVDAARIDASLSQVYRHIVIPLLRPLIIGVATIAMINAFKVFDVVFVMTGGGPVTSSYVLAFMIYMEVVPSYNVGYGSAVATILLLISLACIVTVIYTATGGRKTRRKKLEAE
jgi:ABC-type sugar transport system permease subunit